MSSVEEEATISLPSIAVVAVLGFLIYRYFFSSARSDAAGASSSSSSRNGMRFTAGQVDQISQMFPQLSRRDIMWDLHRNRGSVQATTERVLMGRGLDPAPPSFQPPIPVSTASTTSTSAPRPSKQEPDLITRYNLQTRVDTKGKEKEEGLASGWGSTKEARQQTLQRRRDEMILAARRKMQEKAEHAPSPAPTAD